MVRGRTTAPEGLILGHEITGEVIETGPGVEFITEGDLVSAPFNVSCGRCRNCKERNTGVCLNVNPAARRGIRLCRHRRLDRRTGRVRDGPLRRLEPAQVPRSRPGDGEDPRPARCSPTSSRPDITAACRRASAPGRRCTSPAPGRRLAAAHSAQLLGAAVVIVGDAVPERLEQRAIVRLRDDRHLRRRLDRRADRADPRRPRGRLRRRRGRLRGQGPRR